MFWMFLRIQECLLTICIYYKVWVENNWTEFLKIVVLHWKSYYLHYTFFLYPYIAPYEYPVVGSNIPCRLLKWSSSSLSLLSPLHLTPENKKSHMEQCQLSKADVPTQKFCLRPKMSWPTVCVVCQCTVLVKYTWMIFLHVRRFLRMCLQRLFKTSL